MYAVTIMAGAGVCGVYTGRRGDGLFVCVSLSTAWTGAMYMLYTIAKGAL